MNKGRLSLKTDFATSSEQAAQNGMQSGWLGEIVEKFSEIK